MPPVSRHRYKVQAEKDSPLWVRLQRAFYKTDTIDFIGERDLIPDGTYLVVGMDLTSGTFHLQRWREGRPTPGPREDPF